MCHLPNDILLLLRHFEAAFSERVWQEALVLLVGAILAPGQLHEATVVDRLLSTVAGKGQELGRPRRRPHRLLGNQAPAAGRSGNGAGSGGLVRHSAPEQ